MNTKATFSSFIYSEQVMITLIDDGSTHSRRQRREADTFPPILQFNLTSNTKHIELFLRRNSGAILHSRIWWNCKAHTGEWKSK